MSQSKRTVEQLYVEIGSDFNKFVDELTLNIRATTPIRTGNARNSWKQTRNNPLKSGRKERILYNTADYADKLDKGASRQAPNGIVKPALKRTRKK